MESREELQELLLREEMKNYILKKENEILQDTVNKLNEENIKYDNIRNNFIYRFLQKIKKIIKK